MVNMCAVVYGGMPFVVHDFHKAGILLGVEAEGRFQYISGIPAGPTIPSAPSREPSPARSRTPDDSDSGSLLPLNRLTIRGGDLQVS
jgi:hypothetical protein